MRRRWWGVFALLLVVLVGFVANGLIVRGARVPEHEIALLTQPGLGSSTDLLLPKPVTVPAESPGPDDGLALDLEPAPTDVAIPPPLSVAKTLRLAVTELSDELTRVWDELNRRDALEADTNTPQGVLTEVSLWDDAARVRATYTIVDLDSLQERIGIRQSEGKQAAKSVGVNGEVTFGSAGSLRVGYGLRQQSTDRGNQYVGVADAGLAYRWGERTVLGADLEWGMSAIGSEHTAGVNVSYMLAPNTSLRAGYNLLSFDDASGTKEYHNAAAGLQLRF